jgi:AraC family transcriptional regulator of adaptative response/methylated-DNA-[protein]-cysteine methyltransferase
MQPDRYVIAPCRLGQMLVAASPEGIALLRFGAGATALEAAMRAEAGAAIPAPSRDPLNAWTHAIQATLDAWERAETPPKLPLDLSRGTSFQRAVWSELRAIAWGETRTYGRIARRLGAAAGARAVARACASNPVALLVPCHRVVPQRGGPGGYRWGAARKRLILGWEGVR